MSTQPATAAVPGRTRREPGARGRVPVQRSAADVAVRRLLRIPDVRPTRSRDAARPDRAQRTFSVAMVLSGLRCTLSYVVFPFLLPALGLAAFVGPVVGIPVGLLALFFDALGIRRFFAADHPWRWQMTAIYLAVMALVTYLVVHDTISLVH